MVESEVAVTGTRPDTAGDVRSSVVSPSPVLVSRLRIASLGLITFMLPMAVALGISRPNMGLLPIAVIFGWTQIAGG
jgi:hypothetical protein